MTDFLQKNFPFAPLEVKKLNGYENENYLVKTANGQYIFKIYLYSKQEFDLVEAQNETLRFLHQNGQKNIPQPIPFVDGSYVQINSINGKKSICRILSFLEGNFFGDVVHTEELFQSFGVFLAKMDLKFQHFDNKIVKARQFEWDLQYLYLNEKLISDIPDKKDRNTVQYFFQLFKKKVVPILPKLRKSIIHNDANEWNILVNNGEISGIIDFGDIAHTQLINELAIAITYACYEKENPIEWACIILKSYHRILPITEQEVGILYYLIAARLCTSLCNAAHSKKENPSNEYAYSGERTAWTMLYRLLNIEPATAENNFRAALEFKTT